MKVSPSSLKAFLQCERAWFLRYVQHVDQAVTGTYLQKGQDYDRAVQHYIADAGRGNTVLAVCQVEATKRYLPPPTPGVLTQVKWSRALNGDGDTIQGTADIVEVRETELLVVDTKTTAGREWALDEDTLRLDPQCLIYAYLACLEYHHHFATMRWVYADKRPSPRGWQVEIEVSLSEATAYVDTVVRPAVARMRELEAALDQTEAAVEYRACARCWVSAHCRWWDGRETRPVVGRHLDVVA